MTVKAKAAKRDNPGCGKSPNHCRLCPTAASTSYDLGRFAARLEAAPLSAPQADFFRSLYTRGDFYRPRGMPACASPSLSSRFYDGQVDVWACALPGDKAHPDYVHSSVVGRGLLKKCRRSRFQGPFLIALRIARAEDDDSDGRS